MPLAEAEVQELKKIADARQQLRDKAEAVKVRKQGEAIDTFLAERDNTTTELAPVLERVKALIDL